MNASIRTVAVAAGRQTVVLSCAIAAALGWSQAANAQTVAPDRTFYFGVEGGVEYTDNVSRSEIAEESETIGIAAITLGVNTDRPRLDADAAASLEYRKYLDDSYDDEIVGGIDALLSYAIIPQRFIWVLEDNFAQIARNREEVDTPDNRENVNYLSTGPDLLFQLTGRTSLQLSGRYSDTYYEDTDEDTQGLTAAAVVSRQMSNSSSLSLNGSTTDVDYDEDVFIDYRIDSAFLRWATVTERTSFSLDGGYNQIELDNDTESSGGLLARLELSRTVASRSRIGLAVGTSYETPGEGLQRDQDLTGIVLGADDAISGGDAYQADYAYVNWTTDWPRSSLTVGVNARTEEHEVETDADRDVHGATFRLSRQISRRLDVNLNGRYSEEDLTNIDFKFDEWSVGVGMGWQASERVSVRFELDHIEGTSDDGTRNFDENRAYLGFTYSRSR